MTKQELKMVLKLIDNHTEEHEYNPCFSTREISADGVAKLKKDLIELFGDDFDLKESQK